MFCFRHLLEWCSTILIGGTCTTSSDDAPANILWTWLEKAGQVGPLQTILGLDQIDLIYQ